MRAANAFNLGHLCSLQFLPRRWYSAPTRYRILKSSTVYVYTFTFVSVSSISVYGHAVSIHTHPSLRHAVCNKTRNCLLAYGEKFSRFSLICLRPRKFYSRKFYPQRKPHLFPAIGVAYFEALSVEQVFVRWQCTELSRDVDDGL